jgi:hypothetical protein
MIVEKIEKQNTHNHEACVYKLTKLNSKPGEKQFYVGFCLIKENRNYVHSSQDDNLDLDINRHDFKHEILHYGSEDEMRTVENEILMSNDARNNPEWYNMTNGAQGRTVKKVDLEHLSNMADEINETFAFKGINPVIEIFKKKKMKQTIADTLMRLQVRFNSIITSNVRAISSHLDDPKILGDIELLEKQGKKLLVVVLKDVLVPLNSEGKYDPEGIPTFVDLVVGGNHTLDATIQSKHGKQIRFLKLPKEVHQLDYAEAKQLGSFLNKGDEQPREVNSEEDILKQCINLCIDFGYSSKSEKIDEILENNNCNPAMARRIKKALTERLKKDALSDMMWIDYKGDEGKEIIKKIKRKLAKAYPFAKIISASSGYCEVGKDLIIMNKELDAGVFYDNIIWILHHPSPDAEIKWKTEYFKNNTSFIKKVCDAFKANHKHINKMNHMFYDMPTRTTDIF